ncbi:MAG: UDP-N-acetylmuramoyl-L-alanyl-D-glutamate--2,6-diaminopimelate ligase [Puniceicoccaceae bacterium]|nr:MAG: UDP-N-acetylmuramoyl-L-alanyl-D-glutamate--2,6-diaminopimelate ligase [Puniceicoccaceae bacterium]
MPTDRHLSRLFAGIPTIHAKGPPDQEIRQIAIDSRRVVPGGLFFALPGQRTDGTGFIDEAMRRGAVAVVSPRPLAFVPKGVTHLQVSDPREALAAVARRFYARPDEALEVFGVTGTNGKTTVASLLRHLLRAAGHQCGLLGTIHYDLGARTVPSFRTTPEAHDTFGMLAQMRDAGCTAAALEISSHGLDQSRVRGMQIQGAAFLNLTRDHLDYHGSMEAYFEVKARLFTGQNGPLPKVAAINLDDPYGLRLLERIPQEVRLVTFGLNSSAELWADQLELGLEGSAFVVHAAGEQFKARTPLIGGYNVSNTLAALALLHGRGVPLGPLVAALKDFPGIPGRMERITHAHGFGAVVDYAHTDDALSNALGMLRSITPGRLLVVFGCGGKRDRSKRPTMTRAVQRGADLAWATADNPRGEPLARIFEDMKEGVDDPSTIRWVEDRRHAISLALDEARPGDCVLVAGKGHETFQEFADTVVPFDDRQVLRELLSIRSIKMPM